MKSIQLLLVAFLLGSVTQVLGEPIRVSTFSTILTEIVEKVGGGEVAVTGHVKAASDPHGYEPTPDDLKIVSRAQLILLSAKHMEGYVDKVKEATGSAGALIQVGDQFPSLMVSEGGGHDHGHAHGHGKEAAPKPQASSGGKETTEDPHWWHSVANVQRATRIVRDALIKISPENKAVFTKNAAAYMEKLAGLQTWARVKVAELPRNKRKLVTSHDAFQYFAKENGFTIYAVEGLSAADQPSSRKVADLIQIVKTQGVKAIFAEVHQNPKVLEEVTRETGAKVAGELHADGLGEGDAATFEGMYRHNVSLIVDALK